MHKSGFVNIIGKPNAGKSTLLNILVGEQLAIITPKIQTTRHRILGIVNDEEHQIIYSDTPGIITPAYKLQEAMMNFVKEALTDADIFLLLTDVADRFDDAETIEKLKKKKTPIIILINKIDTAKQEQVEQEISYWQEAFAHADVIAISALHKFNLDLIDRRVKQLLPEQPPFYDKDALTDKPERFIVSEIIREKVLLNYQKEIPYCTEVAIEAFKEEEKIIRIHAIIYVTKDSQKNIIIGQQGKAIKTVGIQARKDMEKFFGKQIYLELYVKVNKQWRDNPRELRNFGYLS